MKLLQFTSLLLAFALVGGCADQEAPLSDTPSEEASTTDPASTDSSRIFAAFAAHDATGAMVIRRLSDGFEWVHSTARADSGFIPASTFKIVNAAVALETGVAEGAEDSFPWDGVQRGNAAWNQDHTLKSAMAVSAVPVYQEIAREIGPERMLDWLQRVEYGNADIGGGIDLFWLTGALRTSARDQVDFLTRFVVGATEFSQGTVEVVSDLILTDEGPDWSLHAKTGWADVAEVGWWSGWVRQGDELYVFSLNMVMSDIADAPKRIEIGRDALQAVGALP